MELISQGGKNMLRDNLKELLKDKLGYSKYDVSYPLSIYEFIYFPSPLVECKLHERAFVYFSHCCDVSVRNIL